MKKTAHISWRQHWFPREMRSQKRAQNPRTRHHPDLGCVSDWLKIFFIQSEVQYPHLGSDASSVCKSFARKPVVESRYVGFFTGKVNTALIHRQFLQFSS